MPSSLLNYAKKLTAVLLFLSTVLLFGFHKKTPRILVFSKTKGFHHASIPKGIEAIEQLGKDNGFAVDTSTNATLFTEHNLKKYKAIIFLSTTGDVLDEEQQKAFQSYIHHGGGFVGIHAATDTEYGWPWYNSFIGAYFKSHPKQQEAMLHRTDSSFIATKALPGIWKHFDEWYNFKSLQLDHAHILLTVDENSYSGGQNGSMHPISWYQSFEGGRMFYTALGHTDACYTDPLFLQHLWGGLQYAMYGKEE
ncbi:MAG: ThuA domain-containing protein [Bacteroidota bacterium]|nr:ThuA domain-containing protein [Bacteroidota bacterium]